MTRRLFLPLPSEDRAPRFSLFDFLVLVAIPSSFCRLAIPTIHTACHNRGQKNASDRATELPARQDGVPIP